MPEVRLKTFQKVIKNQQDLREKLRELIKENQWIKNEDGRDKYYETIAWATTGVGEQEEYESKWKNGDTVYFQTYQRFFNKAAQVDKETEFVDDNGNPVLAEASKVWKNVRDAFLDKKGEALREAFRQSPETEDRASPGTKQM